MVRMGILGAIGETTRSYPGVMPFMTLGLVAGTLWAYRRRRFWTMAGLLLLSCGTVLVHSSGLPAEASARLGAPGQASLLPSPAGGGGPPHGAVSDPGYFSSTSRLHPRFPIDFPLSSTFILEHSSGGMRQGAVTIRFRFRGEGADAARDLQDAGHRNGWNVEVLAPHRMIFRKGGHTVEAWLSFPGHALVLDIPDPR